MSRKFQTHPACFWLRMSDHILAMFYPTTLRDLLEIKNFGGIMWLTFLLLLLSSYESVLGTEQGTLCISNACFTFQMDKLSFEEAHQSCNHNGGYLMTVRDKDEEDVLRSLLSQVQSPHQNMVSTFWIGLKLNVGTCMLADKTLKGYKWVSGEKDSNYSNWEEEPVQTCTEERCVSVNYNLSGDNELKWTAGPCRNHAFYVCKFYFKGMCKPLALLGPGQIKYTAPFSNTPQRGEMKSPPLGTYAVTLCSDEQSHYSVCKTIDGIVGWDVPGPFCRNQNCSTNNGGCEHLCHQDEDRVQCSCKEGYDLDKDGFTCSITDLCMADTCEHQCVMGESGYSCKCPHGFKLHANQHNCSDIDECKSHKCQHHLCINTHGSFKCECKDGYQVVDGQCSDIDECEQARCKQGCSNSIGSFSCYCNQGFILSSDGYSCDDVDECVNNPCPFECMNNGGSFVCTCPQGFYLENDTCTPDTTELSVASANDPVEEETQENFTASLTRTMVELQHQSPHTDSPLPNLANVTQSDQQSNASLVTSFAKTINSKVLICVLGSVIPLLLLVAVTLAIAVFRCRRSKKEAKKKTTTDGYCWVSSGLDPRLEKLYESILTDDL